MLMSARCLKITWISTLIVTIFIFILFKKHIESYQPFKHVKRNTPKAVTSVKSASSMKQIKINMSQCDQYSLPPLYNVTEKTDDQKYQSPKKIEKVSKVSGFKHIYYFNNPEFIPPNVFDKCEYKCKMISSQDKSDAMIFLGSRVGERTKPPKKKQGHIWVFHSKESIVNYVGNLTKWKNLFNWTMTFRRDSDILALNGMFSKRTTHPKSLNTVLFSNKSRTAAWFVSHCETPGKRELLVKYLTKRFLTVDTFGKCGPFKCPRHKEQTCMDILRKDYKFYLSFENSLCRDYITEKSFKLYQNYVDAVPIARGVGDQYSLYLPPNSYIDTETFPTKKELLNYVQKLETNKTLFETYFKWKLYYESHDPFPVEFCELCRRVHHADRYRSIYPDLEQWVKLDNYKTVCRSAVNER